MNEYRFWQTYSDATPYSTPTLVMIAADWYRDAVMDFCRIYRFHVIEMTADDVWVEDSNGATMQYSVNRGQALSSTRNLTTSEHESP